MWVVFQFWYNKEAMQSRGNRWNETEMMQFRCFYICSRSGFIFIIIRIVRAITSGRNKRNNDGRSSFCTEDVLLWSRCSWSAAPPIACWRALQGSRFGRPASINWQSKAIIQFFAWQSLVCSRWAVVASQKRGRLRQFRQWKCVPSGGSAGCEGSPGVAAYLKSACSLNWVTYQPFMRCLSDRALKKF